MNVYNEVRNFCWSLYYEIKEPDIFEEGHLKIVPDDILLQHIFPLLNCCEVAHSISLVNKKWNKLSDNAELLKYLIYRDIVFKPSDWQMHLGLILEISENQKAWDALPNNIGKFLKNKPDFLDKPIGAMHKIVWIPKDTTLNNFGKLFKKKTAMRDDYYKIDPTIRNEFGYAPHQESGFVVMRLKAGSNKWVCGDGFDLKMSNNKYRKPSILESIVCIYAIYFKSRDDINLSYRRVMMYNNHCQANGIRVNVSLVFFTASKYLDGVSVQYDPEPVYVPLSNTHKTQTHTRRRRFGMMK